jgi:hypothetical protein
MMENKHYFIYFGQQNETAILEPFEVPEGLPFPMNAEPSTTKAITMYLYIDLIFGCLLRSKILQYTNSLSIEDSPINLFIWYDQVSML